MADHELLHVFRQVVHPDAEDRRHVDPCFGAGLERVELAAELIVPFEDVLGGPVEHLAGRGQLDRPLLARDQLAFVGQLELRQLLGDGGLAQKVFLRCLGEAPRVRQVTEHFQGLYMHY
jgi:hypothetical protein